MTPSSFSPLVDLKNELLKAQIILHSDLTTRLLYSTDASIYQIEPLGVVFPRSLDELAASVELAASYHIPVLARGSGTSLAGQAIGEALILDCSRYLNHIIEINPETHTAKVEPGVILSSLNNATGKYNLQFGPDHSSAERATIGGSLANNATGAHSILYGMAADHLQDADVVLADGSLATFKAIPLEEATRRAGNDGYPSRGSQTRTIESNIYRTALHIRENIQDEIRSRWPHTWRRASGYNLNYLLPWSPSKPQQWNKGGNFKTDLPYPPIPIGYLNLAPLLAGSEGTLGIIQRATLNLVPLPKFTILGLLPFPSLVEACSAIPGLLVHNPSAIELIPQSIIHLAHSVPAYATRLGFLDQLGIEAQIILVIEFSGEDIGQLHSQVKSLGEDILIATTPAEQQQVWDVRKVGLGILASRPGDHKTTAFIEDMSVPVEYLGEFVQEIERILDAYGVTGEIYGHASVGCLHIRPILNLKDARDVSALRSIAQEAVSLVVRLGGSVSGEHGDGLARSEWLSQMFGSEIVRAFYELKQAADPDGIMNPGKIVASPPMDTNLRYGGNYNSHEWETVFNLSSYGGLSGAVEQCNGAGVCRKLDGFMCPSYQVTFDELHSTRGRANLLRSLLSGRFPSDQMAEETVYRALDLCLACKGCKAECPSAVDLAKLKYEYTQHYYSNRRRPIRDYLFGYIGTLARFGHPFAHLLNPVTTSSLTRRLSERFLGLSPKRSFPELSTKSFGQLSRSRNGQRYRRSSQSYAPANNEFSCLILSDAFTEYFYPEIGLAALKVLDAVGIQYRIIPVLGAGRTLISKGFLKEAKRHAVKLLYEIDQLDPEESLPVIGLEPSEIYTLQDEYPDLFPDDHRVQSLTRRARMIYEYLIRPGINGHIPIDLIPNIGPSQPDKIYLHGHCYQKAQSPDPDGFPTGVSAAITMLESVGYQVVALESGCCGMAGAFGYESEHYDISMRVGELSLLPDIRRAMSQEGEDHLIATPGYSCRTQIMDGTGYHAHHPITLISDILT